MQIKMLPSFIFLFAFVFRHANASRVYLLEFNVDLLHALQLILAT